MDRYKHGDVNKMREMSQKIWTDQGIQVQRYE